MAVLYKELVMHIGYEKYQREDNKPKTEQIKLLGIHSL